MREADDEDDNDDLFKCAFLFASIEVDGIEVIGLA